MNSFRSAIRLSAEWNAANYADEVIQGFLNGVIGLVECIV